MKKSILLFCVLMAPALVQAELSEGVERDNCFKQQADIPAAYRCLSAEKEQSSKKLAALVDETVKRIKANNVGPFNGKPENQETAGEVYARRFLSAQQKWLDYRGILCWSVATELDEDAKDYQSYIDQCQINLNKNHVNEINQMGLPPAS